MITDDSHRASLTSKPDDCGTLRSLVAEVASQAQDICIVLEIDLGEQLLQLVETPACLSASSARAQKNISAVFCIPCPAGGSMDLPVHVTNDDDPLVGLLKGEASMCIAVRVHVLHVVVPQFPGPHLQERAGLSLRPGDHMGQ